MHCNISFQLLEFDSHMLSDSSRHEVSGIVRVSTSRSCGTVNINAIIALIIFTFVHLCVTYNTLLAM